MLAFCADGRKNKKMRLVNSNSGTAHAIESTMMTKTKLSGSSRLWQGCTAKVVDEPRRGSTPGVRQKIQINKKLNNNNNVELNALAPHHC